MRCKAVSILLLVLCSGTFDASMLQVAPRLSSAFETVKPRHWVQQTLYLAASAVSNDAGEVKTE